MRAEIPREKPLFAGERRRVVLFCGGRGARSIIRGFLRRADVELTLLVNGYDDGLSTGRIRALCPGILGPADFRKNHALLLELSSLAPLATLLQRRLPPGATPGALGTLTALGEPPTRARLPLEAVAMARVQAQWFGAIEAFCASAPADADLGDCALGNVILAGEYLRRRSFNAALRAHLAISPLPASLLNVDRGDDRWLVALQADGTVLPSEAAIVAPRSGAPIVSSYLLAARLGERELRSLNALSIEGRAEALAELSCPAFVSAAAADAIRAADLVVFGPGTQHSSLLPSYRVEGVSAALAEGPRARVLITNLREDHDIRGLGAGDVLRAVLDALGPSGDGGPMVSHVFCARPAGEGLDVLPALGLAALAEAEGIIVIEDEVEDLAHAGEHDGDRVAAAALALVDAPAESRRSAARAATARGGP